MDRGYTFWKKAYLISRQVFPRRGKFGQIFFTTRCNLRCDYCQVTERKTKDISLESWKQIVERLARWGVTYISITGGEPTVRKDLEELISYLRRLNIFSRVNSNGGLLTAERIASLAKAGLCSLAISLDSLGNGEKEKAVKSDSERVFELLAYAKKEGIIPEARAVMNLSDPEKIIPLAEETAKREFFFAFGFLQAVGGLFSKPLRFGPIIEGMAKNKLGIWLPADYFQAESMISSDWKCNPKIDAWITVNNDGTLMPCQEWGSEIPALEIDNLRDPRWRDHKRNMVAQCPGCYYDCYYSQEETCRHPLTTLREEFKILARAWKMLH